MPSSGLSPQAELGRYLFNDVRLSREGNRSCALCHAPDLGWTNRFSRTPDIHGQATALNTPALLNVADYDLFMQATPGLTALATTIAVPLFSHAPEEMGMTPDLIKERLTDSQSLYAPLFAAAFPADEIAAQNETTTPDYSVDNVIAALVAYVSTSVRRTRLITGFGRAISLHYRFLSNVGWRCSSQNVLLAVSAMVVRC
ncbi:methylamine utilization protein MauG [Photobacterium aphoticum]|uniref:Methylamine utilization protein MauG n=1 Tax=Photobacterium aphoticum TaxID=754436 RepID=A0A090RBU1_9GAMM|nr:methylamine utilization protein MauG [Photobacterium aphoticum]